MYSTQANPQASAVLVLFVPASVGLVRPKRCRGRSWPAVEVVELNERWGRLRPASSRMRGREVRRSARGGCAAGLVPHVCPALRSSALPGNAEFPSILAIMHDQLQTPQSEGDSKNVPRRLVRDKGGGSVVSVNGCGNGRLVVSHQAWPSSFYVDPATPAAIIWSRATATSRERHVGERFVISAVSRTARRRCPRRWRTGNRFVTRPERNSA
jgi:hypothetical protein